MTHMIARKTISCPTWCRTDHDLDAGDALLHDGMPEPLLATEDGEWEFEARPSRCDHPDGRRGLPGVVLTATSTTCEPVPGRPVAASPFLTAGDWARLADAMEHALAEANTT